MEKFRVDIDLIFETFAGRALILMNDSGTIIKANLDATILVGKNDATDIIGKDWDLTFASLSSDDFSFSRLVNSSTGFMNFSLTGSSPGKSELLKVKVDPFELTEEFPGRYYLVTCRKQETKDWEDMLFKIMKGTEQSFGKNYIQSLTKVLAETLSVDYVFIGKLIKGKKDIVRPISFWDKDQYKEPIDHPLAGSPAADVISKEQKFIPNNVAELYPKDTSLNKLGVKSYLGTPICYSTGKPLGLLVVMDSKPMKESPADAYVLNTFASRVGAEIEFAETQKSLLEKDRKLKNVIDAIPHPIFYKDKEGRYEGVNQAFINAVEIDEEKILGSKSTRPENLKKAAKHDKELLSKPNQILYESDQLTHTGEVKHFLMTKSSILDENGNIEGIAGAAMDITDLKLAEKELKESEEKFRRLFTTANDAIILLSNDVFSDCNEKTLEMFDCTRDEFIGHHPFEFSPEIQPDGRSSEEKSMEKISGALAGKAQSFYWKHKKKTGVTFDAEVSLNSFYLGKELFIQAIVRDVSDKLQLANDAELQKERMEEMYRYISDTKISYDEQLSNLLELATRSLGLDTGMIGSIKNNKYTLIDYYTSSSDMNKGKIYDLQNTYCAITYNQDRLVAIPNMSLSEYSDHPCHDSFKMEAYIGAPFWVKGERYGTLAFLAHKPIDKFRPIDFDFVQMLAQWIGSAMERVQFEENLLERDALLETMLREVPIDFSVRDANLDMVIQSDLSKKYWGNNEGKPIDFTDIDDHSRAKWQDVFKQALSGKVVKGEDNVSIKGKPYSFFSVASPVKVKGKVTEIIVINLDISKIKETEEKLKEQNELLTKLNTELDRFVYSASHDLRAPLASLLGLIDLSTRERNSDSTSHYLELMSKSINTMDRFITDITEYSRNLRLETIANLIDFDKLFTDSFNHIQYMLPGPATSSINITGKTPFYSDYERLKMVMNNLISNSIRYKAYGREPLIELNIKVTEEKAIIEINDNGLGIEGKHLERVFEMFYRANDKNVGSGLGLFIVKETIEKLNGQITMSSELGVGTKVYLELPNLVKEAKS
jgi:PAS domain S-box-containing protein